MLNYSVKKTKTKRLVYFVRCGLCDHIVENETLEGLGKKLIENEFSFYNETLLCKACGDFMFLEI